MRSLTDDLDPEVVRQIDARLDRVRTEHGVAIPWAIESGSRAWGFLSPDSDYDCRFIFVRPPCEYAGPWRPRDVIETPLDAVLDVNGWDLLKAVKLAVKGNATVAEWLRSPIVYGGDASFRDGLLALYDEVADRSAVGRHYVHVGRDQWQRSGASGGGAVALKKVFYALRPAAAVHWMAHHDGLPPMNLDELLTQAPPAPDVVEATVELVARKAVTRELGHAPVPAPIRRFVDAQLERGHAAYEHAPRPSERRERATEVFLELVDAAGDQAKR